MMGIGIDLAQQALEQNSMRAKCPHCDIGCDKCIDGYIRVKFPAGEIFTRACQNPECGFYNGGCISENYPTHSSEPCVICDSETIWSKIQDLPSEDPNVEPGYVKNEHKFEAQRLRKNVDSLRKMIEDLRELAIPLVKDLKLTVEQARLLNVCRICKGKPTAVFVYGFGNEHVHESCWNRERV